MSINLPHRRALLAPAPGTGVQRVWSLVEDNPLDNDVYSGVALTQESAIADGLENIDPWASRESYLMRGGALKLVTAGTPNAVGLISSVGPNTGLATIGDNDIQNAVSYEFDTAADVVMLKIKRNTASGFRILIGGPQGQYISKTYTPYSTADGTYNYPKLDFGTAEMRTIRLEIDQTALFLGAYVDTDLYAINAARRTSGPRIFSEGDSYPNAGGSGNFRHYGNTMVMGAYMGADEVWVDSQNGTGHSNNSGGTGYIFGDDARIANVARSDLPFDLIYVGGNSNDSPNAGTYVATVRGCLAKHRVASPKAAILIAGAYPDNTGPSSAMVTAEGGLLNAALSLRGAGDRYIDGVPLLTETDVPWLYGLGTSAAPMHGPLTFTLPLVAATSGTLSAGFVGPTRSDYLITFSDGTVKTGVTLTNGSTAVSWTGAVTATASASYNNADSGNSDENVYSDGTHLTSPGGYGLLGQVSAANAVPRLNAMPAKAMFDASILTSGLILNLQTQVYTLNGSTIELWNVPGLSEIPLDWISASGLRVEKQWDRAGAVAASAARIINLLGNFDALLTISMVATIDNLDGVQREMFDLHDGSTTNRIDATRSASNTAVITATANNSNQTASSGNANKTGARTLKMSMRKNTTSYQGFVDASLGTNATITVPTGLTMLTVGGNRDRTRPLIGHITQLKILPYLDDTAFAALHS